MGDSGTQPRGIHSEPAPTQHRFSLLTAVLPAWSPNPGLSLAHTLGTLPLPTYHLLNNNPSLTMTAVTSMSCSENEGTERRAVLTPVQNSNLKFVSSQG